MRQAPILLLTAVVGLTGANSLALSPIAADVASSFTGASAADVMSAAAAFGLGTFLSALFLAPQADRFGAARVLAFSVGLFAAAMALSAVAATLPVLVAAQGAAGIAAGMTLPAAYALAAALALPGRVSETLGTVLTGWTLALVLGVGLAALTADLLHWRAVFAGLAALGLAALTAVRLTGWPQADAPRRATSPLAALRIPGVGRALLMATGFMLGFYGFYSYLGPHVTGTLGRSSTAAGMVALAYGLGFGAAVRLDRHIDRIGATRLTAPVLTSIACLYLAMATLSGRYFGLLALAPLWGMAQYLGLTLIVTRMVGLDPARRNAILGLNLAATYLAVFAGTLLFRPVFNLWGAAGCAVASALAVSLALAENRLPMRRPA